MKKILFSILSTTLLLWIYLVNATEYSSWMQEAYEWAYENWIISDSSIDDANLYKPVTKREFLDIMNKFNENVLNHERDLDKYPNTWNTKEDEILITSYELWLSTLLVRTANISEEWNINRAIFGEALSISLRWNKYSWWDPYYKKHLEALKSAGIMGKISDPESTIELKWYMLTTLKNSINNINQNNANWNNQRTYSTEMQEAYEWAYENWIISDSSIDDANLYDTLTNIELADIMNNLCKNILLCSKDISNSCTYSDTANLSSKEKKIVEKSCQYWLMPGDMGSSQFKPYETSTRATFGVALSRALRWDLFEWGSPYYKKHLETLKASWIMNQIDNPENRAEIKWYVLSMIKNSMLIEHVETWNTEENWNTEEYSNNTNCDDAVVKLACSDPDIKAYESCPEVCRPNWILTNNLTKTVEFKANEINRKTVFDGTYKALKNHSIKWITIWLDEYYKQCNNTRYNDINFYVYINWKEVESKIGDLVWHSCLGNSYIQFNEININKWESIYVKIEWELNSNKYKEETYSYRTTLHDSNRDDILASSNLAPIKIVDTSTKCKWMNEANVSHTIKNWIITLKWDAVDWDEIQIRILNPELNTYNFQWTVSMNYREFDYLIGWEWLQDFKLTSKCGDYNYKIQNAKPAATITNNLKKPVEFKENEVSRKTVFDWNLTALTPITIDTFHIKNDSIKFCYKDEVCPAEKWAIEFYLYINWEEYKTKEFKNINTEDIYTKLNEIEIEKSKPINIKIEAEYKWNFETWTKNFLIWLWGSYGEFKSTLVPIKIVKENTDEIIKEKNNENNEKTNIQTLSWTDKNKASRTQNNWYTNEMNEAYKFAYKNWITTANSIEKAKMNSQLTRIAMAKMLSNYAINVLWKQPDASKWIIKFNDVTNKQNSDYDNAVTLAYQLWIMGQNMKNNNFRPKDTVTRAEFATALSRMIYNTEDGKWNTKYYEPHMAKLYEEWIINKKDPTMKEKRWYVMLMLMRSVK